MGFDFVLVVDTEGLWVSELINKAPNEKMTWQPVTGLGNLTVINIFGKTLSEM